MDLMSSVTVPSSVSEERTIWGGGCIFRTSTKNRRTVYCCVSLMNLREGLRFEQTREIL